MHINPIFESQLMDVKGLTVILGHFPSMLHYQNTKAVCCIQSESSRQNLSTFDDDGSDDESGHAEDIDQSSYSVQLQDNDYDQVSGALAKVLSNILLGLKEKFKLT